MPVLGHVETGIAATNGGGGNGSDDCEHGGRATPHAGSVEILTESRKRENAEFSREPYRVSECRVCGETTSTRMNNA